MGRGWRKSWRRAVKSYLAYNPALILTALRQLFRQPRRLQRVTALNTLFFCFNVSSWDGAGEKVTPARAVKSYLAYNPALILKAQE